jgi:hypothetical protein
MKSKYKIIGRLMVGDEIEAEKVEGGRERAKIEGFDDGVVIEKK